MSDKISEQVKKHLKTLLETSDMPDNNDSLEIIEEAWIKKETMFESQIKALHMNMTDTLKKDDSRGAVAVTLSGSLLGLGTLKDGCRWIEYSSIKLRGDVPEIVRGECVIVSKDLRVGFPADFLQGPVSSTSPLYAVGVCDRDIDLAEQEKRIREASMFLTNGFVKINRTIETPAEAPDHFTFQSMVKYISAKNGITQKSVRQIIDDYLTMAEAGILLGERIHLGKLGSVFLNVKPSQKARVGRNPATGEEITIKAKPATPVPRFSFSSYLKERSSEMPIEQIDPDYKAGE
jgi:nucleoid DNA-binding protein